MKKHEVEFGMYPLCIDTSDRSDEDIHNFDATTSAIVCVEGGKRDTKALSIVESKICDSYYISEMEVENYILDTNISNVEVKQLYKDKTTLMIVMEKYKIKHNFNFRVKRSDSKSYVLVCHSDACCWELKASVRKNTDIFKVRYFNSEHTCPLRDRVLSKVQATVGFLSGVTAPKLVNHKKKHTPNDIIEDVRPLYGVEISYQQAWRAKERALKMIRDKPADGYNQMPKYIYMLNIVYPNSYIRMHKLEKNEFMYLFISLRPIMRGFEFCRPVVVVDASHLSGSYRRTFVSASTLDGADCILPLAYGIVDTENDYSWT
ncbi:uncharacterized protein LOC125862093 [Solanum stenotomum]|uniref:uncharacterized protein LOC125862093 n=1 Tax=Solanum stenotomum TaxID=172797 RepID=UPI0020D04AB2|nr:uncharacterized protein LOC125862093 [Solanum stenotomum]